MEITLKLNAKFQPVQGITGDVEYCEIERD